MAMASTRGINNMRLCQKLEIIFASVILCYYWSASYIRGINMEFLYLSGMSHINCHHHENKRGRIIINPIFKRQKQVYGSRYKNDIECRGWIYYGSGGITSLLNI